MRHRRRKREFMDNRLYKLMNWPRIEGIIYSEEDAPHEILGPHTAGRSTLFQTFQPEAESVTLVIDGSQRKKMELVDETGFFACLFPGKIPESYEYEMSLKEGGVRRIKDAYRYRYSLDSKDVEKFSAGIHYTIYDKLGAHPMRLEGVKGTFFAVWAPNAVRVSVVGEFNHWDGRVHPMTRRDKGGIFELFLPDVEPGECYQYEIKTKGDVLHLKADPYAFGQQLRPDTASVVRELSYQWKDSAWMKMREKRQGKDAPVSIYEMYLGSFARDKETGEYLNYRELAPLVVQYVKEMGYTHVELMPVMEHPLDASWGYQTIGYYAPTSRYGTPQDLMFFIDTLHQEEIGVILDWTPAHFPRDAYGLGGFDGTCLYEHLDPKKGTHPRLGTLLYNYGRPQVSDYLIANALYWVERYHADGICMDGVASMLYLDYDRQEGEWIPNLYGGNENLEAVEFLKHLNSIMKKRNPGVYMIAEERAAWPKVTGETQEDGLGFSMKWNDGWVGDFLSYIGYDPYFRAHHHNQLTLSMIYQYSENFVSAFSHHEVVHGKSTLIGKMPGVREDKFANLRLTFGYFMTHPGKKLLFMGQDLGEFREFDETRQTEWGLLQQEEHKGINQLVKDLNFLYRNKPALYAGDTSPEGFEWLNCISPQQCMLAFMRKDGKAEDTLVVIANFAGIAQEFTVGVPYDGKYKELLNTDNKLYGGQSKPQTRAKAAAEKEADGRPYSIEVAMAPLSLCIYSYLPYTQQEKKEIAKKREEKEARLRAEEAQRVADLARKEAVEAQRKADEAAKRAQELEKLAEKQWKIAEKAARE